ncbi:MAG: methyltransferase, TIGR04325 family [Leptolyngbya sp. SIOISBB]|nr:methyltransferase, TIGR04325 family [Leptolyngbya sp. SIOISBB]
MSDIPIQKQVVAALDNIHTSNTWLRLTRLNDISPIYQEISDRFIAELSEVTGDDLNKQITRTFVTLFISSPHSITPYHIDHTSNFLLQISGHKEVHLFNPYDRKVLTEPELEQFYIGNYGSAQYRQQHDVEATIYPLTAGKGVHHPVNAPHWVKNGSQVSVSLSIGLCLESGNQRAKVYQANYYLRKAGFSPRPPGQSPLQDRLKIGVMSALSDRNPLTLDDVLLSGVGRIRRVSQWSASTKVRLQRSLDAWLALPGIRDLYDYSRFPRISNGFRGVFDTFEQAQQAIAQHLPVGYDHTGAHQYSAKNLDQLNPSDRPLLPYLKTVLAASQRVFDLGGSVGRGYYTYQRYVDYPSQLKWQVCEVPSAVEAGTNIARKRGITNLSFTTQHEMADGADVFITCGALQYIQPSLAAILAPLGEKPRHLFIARVPFYEGPDYVTLQSILASKQPYKLAAICPYKIQNRDQFIGDIEALGYELTESWKNDRTCVIPFHPQRFVDGYHSFYFRQVDA